jgi:microcystin-dependent protein
MADPYVGQIIMFGGNFAIRGFSFCDGQIVAISQNEALFSLIGTIYGGDGRVTFGLPDLRGRVPINFGNGPGLTPRSQGEKSGLESVSLSVQQMPAHNHVLQAVSTDADQSEPTANKYAKSKFNTGPPPLRKVVSYADEASPNTYMNAQTLANSGQSIPHNNMQPYLAITFQIALVGIYPSRN